MKQRFGVPTLLAAGALVAVAMLNDGCAKKVAVTPPAQTTPAVASSTAAPPMRPASRSIGTPGQNRNAATATASRMPDQATKDRVAALLKHIEDAYFDYNTSNIRGDAKDALQADARTLSEILSQYPDYKLTVEGYCDERGSAEYNLALGEARASRAKDFLVNSGVPSKQLLTVSFGKEKQVCAEHDESCRQKNRRIHITQAQG